MLSQAAVSKAIEIEDLTTGSHTGPKQDEGGMTEQRLMDKQSQLIDRLNSRKQELIAQL